MDVFTSAVTLKPDADGKIIPSGLGDPPEGYSEWTVEAVRKVLDDVCTFLQDATYVAPRRLIWELLEAIGFASMSHGDTLPNAADYPGSVLPKPHFHADYSQPGEDVRVLAWIGEGWRDDISMADAILLPLKNLVEALDENSASVALTTLRAGVAPEGDTLFKLLQLIVTERDRINQLVSGSPAALDTFLEAYNRFVANEDAASALNSAIAALESGKQDALNGTDDVPGLTSALAAKLAVAGDSGETVVMPVGGSAQLPLKIRFAEVMRIEDFGAVGDDTFTATMSPAATDDSAAFNLAAAWMKAAPANTRRAVRLGRKVYRCDAKIDCVDSPVPVAWIGEAQFLTMVRGNFKAPGEGLFDLSFTTDGNRIAGHVVKGIGVMGQNSVGDPIGFKFDRAFYKYVDDIGSPQNGTKYKNFVVYVTDDNNSHWSNISTYYAGCNLNTFPTMMEVSFTTGSKQVTLTNTTNGNFSAAMAGEPIFFFAGGQSSSALAGWVGVIDTYDDPTHVTLVDFPPNNGSARAAVGVEKGSIDIGTNPNALNMVNDVFTGAASDWVGMFIAVPGAKTKSATGTAGFLFTRIASVVSPSQVILDDAADVSVTDAVIYGPGAHFLGKMESQTGSSRLTNHSWWHNIHHEAYFNAGLMLSKIGWANFSNLKCHGPGGDNIQRQSGSLSPIAGSEIINLTLDNLQLAYAVGNYQKGRIYLQASRGALIIGSVNSDLMAPTPDLQPLILSENDTEDFRIDPGTWAITNLGPTVMPDAWRPFPCSHMRNLLPNTGHIAWRENSGQGHHLDPEHEVFYLRVEPLAHTGDTAETILATIPIPAYHIGPEALVEVDYLTSTGAVNANAKTLRFRLGNNGTLASNTSLRTVNLASLDHGRDNFAFGFRSTEQNQVGRVINYAGSTGDLFGFGASASAKAATSVNMALAQNIYLTAELADAGDALTLEWCRITITRKRKAR